MRTYVHVVHECSQFYLVRIYFSSISPHFPDITVQFERDMYMAFERDGMVDVRIISSSPASFPYDIMVSAMDIEAVGTYVLCT